MQASGTIWVNAGCSAELRGLVCGARNEGAHRGMGARQTKTCSDQNIYCLSKNVMAYTNPLLQGIAAGDELQIDLTIVADNQ